MADLKASLYRFAYVFFWFIDHLFGTRKFEPFRRVRSGLHARLVRSNGQRTRIVPVPERTAEFIDAAELRKLQRGGPVLFKGLAKKIPAIQAWTLPSLIERHGDLKQAFQRSGEHYFEMEVLALGDVLKTFDQDRPTHVLYGGGKWDVFNVDPRMREELNVASWADNSYIRDSAFSVDHIFISGKNHWSPIHTEMGHILSTQVQGSRRWTIVEPWRSPYMFPEISRNTIMHSNVFANATRLRDETFGLTGWECVMEEGDVLFCPLYHWHFVETLRPSVSVATKWATLDSLARHPMLSAFFVTARSLLQLGKRADLLHRKDMLVPKDLR